MLLKIGFDEATSLKLSYDRTYQYLQLISNTISITPVDYWKLSDPEIKPAMGDQYAAGIFRNFDNNIFETSVEGFYKKSQNLLDYKNGATLSMNPYLDADLLEAKGKSYGLEFNIKKTKGKYTGQIAYTWSRSFIADEASFGSEQVNGGAYYPSNYDRPSNLSITGGVKLGDGWDFNFNFVYISGRPATYPDGTYVINNTVVTNYSLRNEDRLPVYDRLDFSFSHDSRRFAEQKRYTIFNFSIYNVYARKNPYSIYFQRDQSGLNSLRTFSTGNNNSFHYIILFFLTVMAKRFLIKYSLFIFWLLSITCVRRVTPPIRESAEILVVEGLITTDSTPYTVKLSYTGKLLNASERIDSNQNFINDARVVIKDDAGDSSSCNLISPGTYQSIDSNFVGIVSRTYTLEIYLSNGKVYVSTPEKINPVPAIDSISVVYDSTYDYDTRPTQLIISVNVHDPADTQNFYRWASLGWVPRKAWGSPCGFGSPPPTNPFVNACGALCLQYQGYNSLNVLSDQFVNGQEIIQPVFYSPVYWLANIMYKYNKCL